ncbi:MAG: acyl carrier protein [Candidatus Saganbacteria bacterium]|nr:acyl carrier protein [Candidatus Saganbacteria bacterium]
MDKQKLAQEIKTLVSKVVRIPEDRIGQNANLFSDLGVDSLIGVEIFAALDKKYHVNLPEAKVRDIKTLNDLVEMVAENLKPSNS